MTMCLIEYQSRYLQIKQEWVEMLLKAEMHIKNEKGENCLMLFLKNEYSWLYYSGKCFNILLETLIDKVDNDDNTDLMTLCRY